MSSEKVKTVFATFETREAADRAIEHLVQQYDINRADIFAQPRGDANTSGTSPSGGDASKADGENGWSDATLRGEVQVSADVALDQIEKARAAFRDAGAKRVVTR